MFSKFQLTLPQTLHNPFQKEKKFICYHLDTWIQVFAWTVLNQSPSLLILLQFVLGSTKVHHTSLFQHRISLSSCFVLLLFYLTIFHFSFHYFHPPLLKILVLFRKRFSYPFYYQRTFLRSQFFSFFFL